MTMLSVVVPAYNEEKNITGAIQDIVEHIVRVVPDTEIVVVDDGSTDKTAAILREEAHFCDHLKVVTQANAGHGPALMQGVKHSKGQWLLFLDSDRQVVLSQFGDHWQQRDDYDVLLGVRQQRQDPWHRIFISACMRSILRLFTGANPHDAGAPYKLLRREVWEEAQPFMPNDCWIPSVLLAARVKLRPELRCLEIPVSHLPRDHGPSSLNLPRLVRFCIMATRNVIQFGQMTKQG